MSLDSNYDELCLNYDELCLSRIKQEKTLMILYKIYYFLFLK